MSFQGTSTAVTPLTGGDHALADGGYFYVAGEATPGVTGIVGPVSTTLDETKALLSVYNGSTTGQVLIPRFLRLQVRTIGTGGTRVHVTQAIDSINRYSSGGSALTLANTNMGQATSSAPQVYFGAVGLTASSSNRRYIANTTFKATAIETAEDTYQLSWGGSGQLDDPASLSNVAAALSNVSFAFAPVELAAGQSLLLHQWRASITVGITFGVEFGFILK